VRNAHESLTAKPHFGDTGLDGRIILKYILGWNRVWGCGLGSSGSRQRPMAGCCEHGNEPSGLHKSPGISLTEWLLHGVKLVLLGSVWLQSRWSVQYKGERGTFVSLACYCYSSTTKQGRNNVLA